MIVIPQGAPPNLPFHLDFRTLRSGLNFTLQTDAGDIDLLGEIAGIGDFKAMSVNSNRMRFHGREVAVMSLDLLQKAKAAAGRGKDLLDLAEIRDFRHRTRKP